MDMRLQGTAHLLLGLNPYSQHIKRERYADHWGAEAHLP